MWNKLTKPTKTWSRAIILVDMNAFFCSVEQLDYPDLIGRPIGITNGDRGTCIITSSYEARAYGIKTGMRLVEAKKLCPHFIQIPARPKRYAEMSTKIMSVLSAVTPEIEIFSVDEAFLDVTQSQLLGTPEELGLLAKKCVFEASGLLCSIGVSGDKTTAKFAAKFAAKLQKPNGFTVIPPWESKERLRNVPVTELCGIARGIGNFLATHGVHVCGDMEKLPISILAQRFGNPGRRIWYMCQGMDPEGIKQDVALPKSMGHGKVMPPNTTDKNIITNFLMHMSEKLGVRLRDHHFTAQHFFVGLRTYDHGWVGGVGRAVTATNDGNIIYNLGLRILNENWKGEAVFQIQVTATDPQEQSLQLDLFQEDNTKRKKINTIMDEINKKFGEFTVALAPLLDRSDMPNVIAPAWKPSGHRNTI